MSGGRHSQSGIYSSGIFFNSSDIWSNFIYIFELPVSNLYLKSGEVGVNSADEGEISPLHVAAANGQEDVVSLLLSRGANVDQRTGSGWTPFIRPPSMVTTLSPRSLSLQGQRSTSGTSTVPHPSTWLQQGVILLQ